LLADPLLSAHGRTDVDSERTAHQRRRLQGGERLEGNGHRLRRRLPPFHLPERPQESRVMRGDLDRFEKPGPPGEPLHRAFDKPVDEPGVPAGLVRLDTFHPRHVHHLQIETIVQNCFGRVRTYLPRRPYGHPQSGTGSWVISATMARTRHPDATNSAPWACAAISSALPAPSIRVTPVRSRRRRGRR